MTREQPNGGDHVTWRDLDARTAELVRWREIDARFKSLQELQEALKAGVDEARKIAREVVLAHDMASNEFRQQLEKERGNYANITWVMEQVDKLQTSLQADLNKVELSLRTDYSKETQALSTRITALSTSSSGANSDIVALQRSDAQRRGKELGILGLIATGVAAIVGTVVSLLTKLL